MSRCCFNGPPCVLVFVSFWRRWGRNAPPCRISAANKQLKGILDRFIIMKFSHSADIYSWDIRLESSYGPIKWYNSLKWCLGASWCSYLVLIIIKPARFDNLIVQGNHSGLWQPDDLISHCQLSIHQQGIQHTLTKTVDDMSWPSSPSWAPQGTSVHFHHLRHSVRLLKDEQICFYERDGATHAI